jgi:hypothetical protein
MWKFWQLTPAICLTGEAGFSLSPVCINQVVDYEALDGDCF